MQSQQLSIICVVCAGGCNLALTAAGVVVRRGTVSSAVPGDCNQTLRAAAHHLDFSPDGARHNSRFAFRHDGNWNVVSR